MKLAYLPPIWSLEDAFSFGEIILKRSMIMIGSYHYMYAKHNCSGHITHIKQTHIDDGASISHASPLFHQSLLNGSIFPPFSFYHPRSLKNVFWFFFLFLIWNMHWNSEFNKFEVSAWAQYITSITVWALSWLLLTRVLCSPLSADDGPVFCLGVGLLLSLHFSPLPGQSHLLFALLPCFFSVLPLFSFFSIGGPLHHQSG